MSVTTSPSCCGPETADHLCYAATRSLCRVCKSAVDARILFCEDGVWLAKHCVRHGRQQCRIASSVDWYLETLGFLAARRSPHRNRRPVQQGCPADCGPCEAHQQRLMLPVVPLTSACNLNCPICYTINRNRNAFFMQTGELEAILDHLRADGDELDIINFTGGEPTLHPELAGFLELSRAAGVRRLTLSTNGLALADEALVEQLAARDARIILSLDTFNEATDRALHRSATLPTKLRALELLGKHQVNTTILPTIAAGHNDSDLPALLELVLSSPNVVSLELHPMCFTGQGGMAFQRSARITIPDLHQLLDQATSGGIRGSDFVPSPLAHPHCYSICYLLLLEGGGWVPFARFMGRRRLYELLTDSLYIEPRDRLERILLEVIDELWAEPQRLPQSEEVLRTLKGLIDALYPHSGPPLSVDERRRIGEQRVKAIYIHAHMDEESFDVSRIKACCVGVPGTDGSAIPTCAYNVLYRQQDPRFAGGAP